MIKITVKALIKTLHYICIGGVFLLLMTPLVVTDSLFFPFVTGKVFFFRIVVELAFASWVLWCLFDKNVRPRLSSLLVAFTAFVIVVFLADIFGKYAPKSLWSNFERMEGFVTIIHLFAAFVITTSVLRDKLWWKAYFIGAAVVGFIISCYGLLQIANVLTIHQGGVRLDATIGNAAYLGAFMLFQIFIVGLLWLWSTRTWERWLWVAVGIFDAIILYNTQTRGAVLGVLGGLFITAILVAIFGKEHRRARRAAVITVGSILALALIFLAVRTTAFVQENPTLNRFANITPQELTTQARYYVWPMAVKGFLDRPLLGWGQENFNYVFNENYVPQLYNQEQWFDRAHNVALDWLVSTGALGILSFLLIFVTALWLIWKKHSDFTLLEKSLLTGVLAAYFFQGMFVFDNITSYLMLILFLSYIASRAGGKLIGGKREVSPKVAWVATPILVALMVYTVYIVNVPGIVTARDLVKALEYNVAAVGTSQPTQEQPLESKAYDYFEKALSNHSFGTTEVREQLSFTVPQILSLKNVSSDLKNKFVTLVNSEFTKQFTEKPNDARYYLLYGSFLQQIGDYKGAIKNFEIALELSPNKLSIMLSLGQAKSLAGDNTAALAEFLKTTDLVPQYTDARILYAYGLFKDGQTDKAKSVLAALPVGVTMSDNRVLGIYAGMKDYQKVAEIWQSRVAAEQNKTTNPQAYFSLAAAYIYLNRPNDAISVLQTVAALVPQVASEAGQLISQIKAGTLTAKDLP